MSEAPSGPVTHARCLHPISQRSEGGRVRAAKSSVRTAPNFLAISVALARTRDAKQHPRGAFPCLYKLKEK
eukprot:10593108-Alexandrium_andersonii.AAC.1